MRRSGRNVNFGRGDAEFFGERPPGVAELARHADQRRIEAEPRLGADDHQIEPVGQPQLNLFGAFICSVPQINPRRVITEHDAGHRRQ